MGSQTNRKEEIFGCEDMRRELFFPIKNNVSQMIHNLLLIPENCCHKKTCHRCNQRTPLSSKIQLPLKNSLKEGRGWQRCCELTSAVMRTDRPKSVYSLDLTPFRRGGETVNKPLSAHRSLSNPHRNPTTETPEVEQIITSFIGTIWSQRQTGGFWQQAKTDREWRRWKHLRFLY